jgi:GTP-binding protein
LVTAYLRQMQEQWDELPRYFVTSAETGAGREAVLDFVDEVNRQLAAEASAAGA